MRHFVFVGIENYRRDATAEFRARARAPDARQSTFAVATSLASKAVRLVVTHGGCSCNIFVGDGEPKADDSETRRQRYRRRGWSEAKIERALASARQHSGRTRIDTPAQKFEEALAALVGSGARVSPLAHEFSGAEDDPVEITGVTEPPVAFNLSTQRDFSEDRLVRIVG